MKKSILRNELAQRDEYDCSATNATYLDESRPVPRVPAPHASFFRRAVAFVIDNVLVLYGLFVLIDLFAWSIDYDGYWIGFLIGYYFYLSVPVIVLYWSLAFALMQWMQRGRTPGKVLCGVAVREAESGGPAGLARLLKRELFRGMLALLLFVPLIVDGLAALWRPSHETWHDKVAGTSVVRLPTARSARLRSG